MIGDRCVSVMWLLRKISTTENAKFQCVFSQVPVEFPKAAEEIGNDCANSVSPTSRKLCDSFLSLLWCPKSNWPCEILFSLWYIGRSAVCRLTILLVGVDEPQVEISCEIHRSRWDTGCCWVNRRSKGLERSLLYTPRAAYYSHFHSRLSWNFFILEHEEPFRGKFH